MLLWVCYIAMPRSVLIVGCGFVGLPLARDFASSGWETHATTASAASLAKLHREQFHPYALDITNETGFQKLARRNFDVVIHCASSGRGVASDYEAVFLSGTRNLMGNLECGNFIFTSSTSVYAQTDGSWVNERSPANPSKETGQILRATEDLVLGAGGAVARLAGLYGPGRCVPLQKLLDDKAIIEGSGDRVVNMLHQLDAAAALRFLAEMKSTGLFNAVDNEPVAQLDWFRSICDLLGKPLPPYGPREVNRKRGWTSKKVSNRKLRSLGWEALYPTFREGVAAILGGGGNWRAP
jgi:nucleoside-diphosphate-sugar epimerase